MEQMLYAKLLRSYDPKYVIDDGSDVAEAQRERKLQVSRESKTMTAERLHYGIVSWSRYSAKI